MHAFSNPLAIFVIQTIIVVACARTFGLVTRRLQQPMVIAEMVAGIVLGPSVLGALSPTVATTLFPKPSLPALGLTSQVGVLLFMFIIGLELHPKLLRGRARQAVAISHASIVVPFALGAGLAVYLYPSLAPAGVNRTSFILFMGVSMSITAFPVLARILVERRLLRSRVGATAISCAAVDDVTAWCVLAFVVSVARSVSLAEAARTVVLSSLYVVAMVWVVRPFLARLADRRRVGLSQGIVAVILLLALASALVTEFIGIHALFGAFLFGAIFPKEGSLATALSERIEDVVVVLLLPLFFAYSGLRTQIGLVETPGQWLTCGVIIVLACAGKFGGSVVAARITGFQWREASAIGILMNTRGLMELIVLNIGLDLGVISPRLFTMMVIMALVTTFMTTPLLELVYPLERFKRDLIGPESIQRLVPRFTALACISEATTAPGIITLASALTGPTSPDTRVYALRLVAPDERASALIASSASEAESDLRADMVLDAAVARGHALRSEVRPLSFLSSTPARDICDVAEVKRADIVLLGWEQSKLGAKVRAVLKEVLQETPRDVAVLIERNLVAVQRILVGFGGSEADAAALRLACRIAESTKAHVTVLAVSVQDDPQVLRQVEKAARRGLHVLDEGQHSVIAAVAAQPRTTLLSKSAEGFDLLVMSVGPLWGIEPHTFGLDPQEVIAGAACSVALIRKGSASVADEAEEEPPPPSSEGRFATLRPQA